MRISNSRPSKKTPEPATALSAPASSSNSMNPKPDRGLRDTLTTLPPNLASKNSANSASVASNLMFLFPPYEQKKRNKKKKKRKGTEEHLRNENLCSVVLGRHLLIVVRLLFGSVTKKT